MSLNKNREIILPKKPVEPEMSECCQRGCENCIFVYYEKALKRWQKKIDEINKKET